MAEKLSKAEREMQERETFYFALYNDGGNCWGSHDSGNWYWAASEDETKAQFRARCNRAAERHAQNNYREYVKGSWTVKIFSDLAMFKAAAAKVGLHPNTREYEEMMKQDAAENS